MAQQPLARTVHRIESLHEQSIDGRKVFDIRRAQRQAMFERCGGDQCITHAQAMRERKIFHQRNGATSDRRSHRQLFCVAHRQTFLHREQFRAAAHALKQFHPGNRRDGEARQLVDSLRGAGQAAQMPDQYITIDQHPDQSSLREPSRL